MKIIQVSPKGTSIRGSKLQIQKLRCQFKKNHCLCLTDFLPLSLVKKIQNSIRKAQFKPRVHKDSGSELAMKENEVMDLLHFILNHPSLFRFFETITGCGPINLFHGRIYSMLPNSGHQHHWHGDTKGSRLLGVSINLSPSPFKGGSLQLRIKKTKKIVHEAHNTGLGNLLIFRITKKLQHRVLPVTGKNPKLACAGWFFSKPHYLTLIKKSLSHENA